MSVLQSAGFVKSAKTNLAWELALVNSFSVLRISYSEAKPLSTTLAPEAAKDLAIPKPMPESDPVTTAVFPFKKCPII